MGNGRNCPLETRPGFGGLGVLSVWDHWKARPLPDLARLRLVLDTLPDEDIVAALDAGRGRGRNDYPVLAMWRALLAGIVFQHASIQSLLRELGRNPALLELCGFDPLPFQGVPTTALREGPKGRPCAVTHRAAVRSTVPSHWNFSRFLGRLVRLADERGRVSCVCPETGEARAMAFQGFEAGRGACGTLKYRCPAAAFGFDCAGRDACHRAGGVQPGEYGRIVRINLDSHDRRIFTPTPWGSPSWRRGYNRRSAMERINSRIDQGFGFETHYIRGLAKMKTRVGLALAVMMALALGQARASHAERMRSLVGPVPLLDTG